VFSLFLNFHFYYLVYAIFFLSHFSNISLLSIFITAQTKCETDDDCLQVLIYDLHGQHNLRPSVLKCVDNLCAMVAMEWVLVPKIVSKQYTICKNVSWVAI
jgi:hypothetical protein